jgi:hypothetical protein
VLALVMVMDDHQLNHKSLWLIPIHFAGCVNSQRSSACGVNMLRLVYATDTTL